MILIMLVNGSLLKKAKGKYALGAFDVNNLEMVRSVISACVEERAPVVIQTTEKALDYAGIEYLSSIIKIAAKNPVPVVLHLDHGKKIETVKKCIQNGYTSVMFDGSRLPFAENVKITKQAVALAKRKKVTVEAELGVIPGKEDYVSERSSFYTDPKTAKDFVKKTGVSSLAVSIGTKHGLTPEEIENGMRKGSLKLNFDILREIGELVDIPLVLHGGSDVPEADIRKCIRLGVSKINIDTELRVAFKEGVTGFVSAHPEVFDPRDILTPAIDNMKAVVKKKVNEFGSARKA
jgi:fructose-bisphosphate aldolase class II